MENSGIYIIETKISAAQPTALGIQAIHPHEKMTMRTAMVIGIELTKKWKPYKGCSTAKTYHHALPKSADSKAAVKLVRFFVDLIGPTRVAS